MTVDGHIIRAVEAEFASFGFSDGGAVAGDDICFLHSDNVLVVYATFYIKDKNFLKMDTYLRGHV
jgi:hypothetical protein